MIEVYLEMQRLTFDSDLHLRDIPEAAWTRFMKQDQVMAEIYAPVQAMVKPGFEHLGRFLCRIACSNNCETAAGSHLARRQDRMGNLVMGDQARLDPQSPSP